MGKELPERRKNPRFSVGVKTIGQVTATCEASLINISLGGVMIEHADVVRPGTISQLDLPILGRVVRVMCRVARSVFARQEQQPDGELAMIYRTGLEFLDLPEETRQVINEYIQSIKEDEQAIPTDGRVIHRSYICNKCGKSFDLADSEVRPVFADPRKRPVQAGDLFYHDHGTCQEALTCTFTGRSVPWTRNSPSD